MGANKRDTADSNLAQFRMESTEQTGLVTVESVDGVKISIDSRWAFRCRAVKKRLENGEVSDSGSVVFNNISGAALIRVFAFCQYEYTTEYAYALQPRKGAMHKRHKNGPLSPLVDPSAPHPPPVTGALPSFCLTYVSTTTPINEPPMPSMVMPAEGESFPLVLEESFIAFIQRSSPAILCELASAAYYLEVKPLVDLTCRAIADTIKGKTPEEIRSTFNIVNDFSPAEEEQVTYIWFWIKWSRVSSFVASSSRTYSSSFHSDSRPIPAPFS